MTGRISRAEVKATGTTTPRTLGDRASDVVNVKDFGVVGDGTDQASRIQKALTSLDNRGGGTLLFEAGVTYKVNKRLYGGGNTTILCSGATFDCTDLEYDKTILGGGALWNFVSGDSINTTITANITKYDQIVIVTNPTGLKVGDIVRLYSDQVQYHNGSAIAENVDINMISKIAGNAISLSYPIILDYDNTTHPVTFESIPKIENCKVIGGEYLGGGVTELSIDNNKGQSVVYFRGVVGCEFSNATTRSFYANAVMADKCMNFTCYKLDMYGREAGNIPVEGVDSSFYGVVAVRSRNSIMRDCWGVRVRHVGDAAQCINVTQDNCTGGDTHRAAFGSHEATYNLIVKNCNANNTLSTGSGISFRAAGGIVTGCTISASTALTTAVMLVGESGDTLDVSNNTFTASATNAGVSIEADYIACSIKNNTITSPSSRAIYLGGKGIHNYTIADNTFVSLSGVEIGGPSAGLVELKSLKISDNIISGYTKNAVTLRGCINPSNPAEAITIKDNTCTPLLQSSSAAILFRGDGYYGDFVKAVGNSHFGDDSLVVQVQTPRSFKSQPVIEYNDSTSKFDFSNRVVADANSLPLPDNTTVFRGAIVNRKNASVGQPSSWTVVSSGTYGSFTGVTGSITAGSNTLSVSGNDNTKAFSGSFIIVTGAGSGGVDLIARIDSVNDLMTELTLDTSALTTVSSATVSRRNPTLGITSVIS